MTIDSIAVDERVLDLRRQGKGFKTIGAAVGLERASQVNKAFNRALRRLPPDEQSALRADEQLRLDRLAEAVRRNDSVSKETIERRLHNLDRYRAALTKE